MTNSPSITTARTVEIYREALAVRRIYCADNEFFKMSVFWRDMCGEDTDWKIKEYPSKETVAAKRKAGVITFGDALTLLVEAELFKAADDGCLLENFTLAHEAGHVMLGHHETGRVVKNFRIFEGPNGRTVRPPNVEELEAHYAAVFLQCGVLIRDRSFDSFELARRSYSDPYLVKKLRKLVCLDVFESELRRQQKSKGRVVL